MIRDEEKRLGRGKVVGKVEQIVSDSEKGSDVKEAEMNWLVWIGGMCMF